MPESNQNRTRWSPGRALGVLLAALCLGLLCACNSAIESSGLQPFANYFAKSDTDLVADTGLREMNRLMEDLLVKLYRRNPRELHKVAGMTIDQRRDQIFDTPGRLIFAELDQRQGTDALNLAFAEDYSGDRVFALMTGLVGMVRSTYNWQDEQYLFDSLDPQAFFDCARNLEILAWRLSNKHDAAGELLLLTNGRQGEVENLSFERLFGKMIAIEDMMAFVVADKLKRGVNHAVQSMATAVFVPLGI